MLSCSLGDGAQLRTLAPWNAAELLEYTNRHRKFLEPWLPWTQVVEDVEGARGFLQRYADRVAADTGSIYGIWLDDVLVGGTLFRIFDVKLGNCELGVWLSPEATGRGLVTKAAGRMIDWAVDTRGMSRVEWICDNTNEPSKATAKRLGMTHEATMRQLYAVGDRRVDAEMWAILADEWRARRTA